MSAELPGMPPGAGGAPAYPPPPQQQQQQHQHQQQHQQQLPQFDPAAIKLTRGTSCVRCQQRKVRCDKNKPCANCVKANAECRVVPPQPPRRRKKRLQERDLVDRLKRYESLLAEHGVKVDAIGHNLRAESGPHPDEVDDLNDDFEGLRATPDSLAGPHQLHADHKIGRQWFSLHREFRASEQILNGSSDEEEEGPGSNIHRAFDRMFSDEGFPFVIIGSTPDVWTCHPPTIHIFKMWQIYIDNINPLLKITHVPSIQSQIIEAGSSIENAPKNIEALLFCIYFLVITSMDDTEVRQMFNESRKDLIARYHSAAQLSLSNAGFMRAVDPILMQAYLLYLFAVRWLVDPRQVFCLNGIAMRIAQRMGLHRDPGQFGLPPFDVEQRRRLWWTLIGYDRRIGEMTGSTVSALSSAAGDCRIPLNVNDSDLHTDGTEMPAPHTGPTEMLFALTRIELAQAVASDSNRDAAPVSSPATEQQQRSSPGASAPACPGGGGVSAGGPANPGSTSVIRLFSNPNGPAYTIDGFCAYMENTYLAHCDPKIPLHFFTLTMTRQALCKMRVINFLVRMHKADPIPLEDVERDNLFLQATQMIEYDNVVQSSESLKPFRWYAMHHFPFPAYMFLVLALRHRTTGPMVERTWDAISRNYDLRGILNQMHSPMHVVFSNHFVKAWDARVAAMAALGKAVDEPHFMPFLRKAAEARRRERKGQGPPASGPYTATTASTSSASPASVMTSPGGSGYGHGHGHGHGRGHGQGPPAAAMPAAAMAGPEMQTLTSLDDSGDMDWSYFMSAYNDDANFPPATYGGAANFGAGPPMGGGPPPVGMGGMGMQFGNGI